MIDVPVPLFLITSNVTCVVEINGRMIGEVTDKSYLAHPLSSDGEYYISVIPLKNNPDKLYYSVTRKISLKDGAIQGDMPDDVIVTEWQGGIIELYISVGVISPFTILQYPCVIESIEVKSENRVFTLYYDNGLRILMEENGIQLFGRAIGNFTDGTMETMTNGKKLFCVVKVKCELGERMIIFDLDLNTLFDECGDSVGFMDANPYTTRKLDSIVGHEEITKYKFDDKKFEIFCKENGFYTHQRKQPEDEKSLAIAFCEAVRDRRDDEALSFLTSNLRDADVEEIRTMFGEFSIVKSPITEQSGVCAGILRRDTNVKNRFFAKLLRFEFSDDMLIANINFE
ncbi:MAG: hypothetical protein RRY79_02230 [Clostridia bacterium]